MVKVGINRLPYKFVTKLILLGHWNPRETTPRVFHHGIPEDIPIDPMDHMVSWGCTKCITGEKLLFLGGGGEHLFRKASQGNVKIAWESENIDKDSTGAPVQFINDRRWCRRVFFDNSEHDDILFATKRMSGKLKLASKQLKSTCGTLNFQSPENLPLKKNPWESTAPTHSTWTDSSQRGATLTFPQKCPKHLANSSTLMAFWGEVSRPSPAQQLGAMGPSPWIPPKKNWWVQIRIRSEQKTKKNKTKIKNPYKNPNNDWKNPSGFFRWELFRLSEVEGKEFASEISGECSSGLPEKPSHKGVEIVRPAASNKEHATPPCSHLFSAWQLA